MTDTVQAGGELVHLALTNWTDITQQIDKGTVVGTAEHVTAIPIESIITDEESPSVHSVSVNSNPLDRKQLVGNLSGTVGNLTISQPRTSPIVTGPNRPIYKLETMM